MLSMFQAMLKGSPLLSQKSDDDRWSEQAEVVQANLDNQLGEQATLGRWQMQFHPASFEEERWEKAIELKSLVEKHSVRLGDAFPSTAYDYRVLEWGICSHEFEDIFGLTRSGLFVANRVFREDTTEFRNPWQPNPNMRPGQWFEFQSNMAQLIEFFMFMSRFCHEFDAGEHVIFQISASPLADRVLVSQNPRISMFSSGLRVVLVHLPDSVRFQWKLYGQHGRTNAHKRFFGYLNCSVLIRSN